MKDIDQLILDYSAFIRNLDKRVSTLETQPTPVEPPTPAEPPTTTPPATEPPTPVESASFNEVVSLLYLQSHNSWLEIASTRLRPVLTPISLLKEIEPKYDLRQVTGPMSTVYVWTSSSFDKDNKIIYFGAHGGHNAYAGNEVYAFSLVDMKWKRLTDPSGLKPVVNLTDKGFRDLRTDERVTTKSGPRAVHTYDGEIFSPKTASFFMTGVGLEKLWEFLPATKEWVSYDFPENTAFTRVGSGYNKSVLNPFNKNLIYISGGRSPELLEFDPVAQEWVTHQKLHGDGWLTYSVATLRPLSATKAEIYTFDRSKINKKAMTLVKLTLTYDPLTNTTKYSSLSEVENSTTPIDWPSDAGLAYDPTVDKFVSWFGENKVLVYSFDTGKWDSFTTDASNSPNTLLVDGRRKRTPIYGKWHYIVEFGAFIGYSNVDRGWFVYKPPYNTRGEFVVNPDSQEPKLPTTIVGENRNTEVDFLDKLTNILQDRDVVTLSPQEHTRGFGIFANNVTIEGVRAKITGAAIGPKISGKAAVVVKGNFTTLRDFEISGITVPDGNGACIRLEGEVLDIDNMHLHDSQMGLLTDQNVGQVSITRTLIENIGHNQRNASLGHSIYYAAQQPDGVLVIRETDILASGNEGHEVKSRAARTIIQSTNIKTLDSRDSRSIDIPNGGILHIFDSYIETGPNTSNWDVIGYGLALRNPKWQRHNENRVVIENTIFVLKNDRDVVFHPYDDILYTFEARNNIVVGGRKDIFDRYFGSEPSNKWFATVEDWKATQSGGTR